MKKSDYQYKPHLAVTEFFMPPQGEWSPQPSGWSLIQVRQGSGYYLQPELNQELEPGTVLLMAGDAQGKIRASQLGGLSFFLFNVMPARLIGLMTSGEQNLIDAAAARKESALQIFPPQNPVALKMAELCANQKQDGLVFRLKLLQLFVETLGNELEQKQTAASEDTSDARTRLEIFLKQTPPSELLEMSFDDLARLTHCTVRHLSRIFQQVVGMSFREKRAELRLARARELLASGNSKVIEVALESGYKSLSLFNIMFARRFGTSPGKWREQHGKHDANENRGRKKKRFALAENGSQTRRQKSVRSKGR